MSKFPRKGVFHSELAQASPLRVVVTSNVNQSKYPDKRGKAGEFYVNFTCDGEAHNYLAEHEMVAGQLADLANQGEVTIRAEGRGNDACIITMGATERETQPPPRTRQLPSEKIVRHDHVTRGPTTTRDESPPGLLSPKELVTQEIQRSTNAFYLIKEAVTEESEQSKINGIECTPEFFQAQCMAVFIRLDRAGLVAKLPGDRSLWSLQAEKMKAAAAHLDRRRELPPPIEQEEPLPQEPW